MRKFRQLLPIAFLRQSGVIFFAAFLMGGCERSIEDKVMAFQGRNIRGLEEFLGMEGERVEPEYNGAVPSYAIEDLEAGELKYPSATYFMDFHAVTKESQFLRVEVFRSNGKILQLGFVRLPKEGEQSDQGALGGF